MKILLIAYYYPPIRNVGTIRPQKMVKYLSETGHDVMVLTCSYSGHNEIEEGIIRIDDPGFNNKRRGIRWFKWFIRRIRVELKNTFGKYSSIFDMWLGNIVRSHDFIRSESSPDIIISTYPPVETLQAGLILSKKFGVPLICDFRDGLTLDPIEIKSFNKFRSVRDHYRRIEKESVVRSSGILSFSEPHSEYIREFYGKDNVVTVLNGYDQDDFISLPDESVLEKRELNIVFTGRIELSYKYNSIEKFINSIEKIFNAHKDLTDGVRFHFAGELTGRERRMMSGLIKAGIFKIYGNVKREISLSMQRDADILLVFSQHDRKSSVPLKYFEYLFWKKPVIAFTKNNYLELLIKRDGTGVCLDPVNEDDICTFFTNLFSESKKFLKEYKEPGNNEKYSIKSQLGKIDKLFEIQ